MKRIDLTGQKFNRLTVISLAKETERVCWNCVCDCGKKIIVSSSHLKTNHTKSCGCLNLEKMKERSHKLYANNYKYDSPSIATAKKIFDKTYNDGDLKFENFLKLSQLNCYYCNCKPNNKQNSAIDDKKASKFAKENGDFIYNGLDRVDNLQPHNINNVVTCCKWCNYSKRNNTLEEFLIWINKVYKFNFENKDQK